MSFKEKILAQLGIFKKTPEGLQYYMQDNEVYIVGYKDSKKQVTKFLIPDSVESIGEQAFEFCDILEDIIFPDNLKLLLLGVCSENPKLKTIHLPESLEEIPDCFAGGCSSLEKIIIPESVKIIGELAFYDCENLKTVKLPENLKLVKKYAFATCPELKPENIIIPAGCEVHPEAFDN